MSQLQGGSAHASQAARRNERGAEAPTGAADFHVSEHTNGVNENQKYTAHVQTTWLAAVLCLLGTLCNKSQS